MECISFHYSNVGAVAFAIVAAKLDYCNSLLYGTSKGNFMNIQHFEIIKIVLCCNCHLDHIGVTFSIGLYWPPIYQRIE